MLNALPLALSINDIPTGVHSATQQESGEDGPKAAKSIPARLGDIVLEAGPLAALLPPTVETSHAFPSCLAIVSSS